MCVAATENLGPWNDEYLRTEMWNGSCSPAVCFCMLIMIIQFDDEGVLTDVGGHAF